MAKKISAIVLALVLCLSVMVVPVSAAVELGDAQIALSLKWDKDYYSAGETAYLSVYMDAADDLSLYTGGFVIGVNSAVISPDDNTQDYLRENVQMSETFKSYYKDPSTQFAWLASTVVPKLQAANTAEENALYDQYIKFNAGKNTGGWHENTGTTKAGFNGSDFDPEEAILVIPLIIADGVADGTELKVGITSGSTVCSPVQTSWKYYTSPGTATKTANIAATDFDLSQAVVTATVGEDPCENGHPSTTATEEVVTAPTCTVDGLKKVTYTCDECGKVDRTADVVIPAAHKYDAEVTAPTCTEAGYTTYTCSVCGDNYTSDPVDALGHTAAEAVVENEVAATCKDDGSYDSVVYCSVCDAELSRETVTVTATGAHIYATVVDEKAATCTEDGYVTKACGGCGLTETTVVTATGHSYNTEVTAPTCTAQGYTTYTCTVCGDTYVADYVDALGHTYTSEETKAPTYTETGVMTYTCACGETYTEVIPMKSLVAAMKGQIRFRKNADGTYAGRFDIRAIAEMKKADFLAAFGSQANAEKMIKKFGFVFAKGSVVAADEFDMAAVKDIVENGASYTGYTEKTLSQISTSVSAIYGVAQSWT